MKLLHKLKAKHCILSTAISWALFLPVILPNTKSGNKESINAIIDLEVFCVGSAYLSVFIAVYLLSKKQEIKESIGCITAVIPIIFLSIAPLLKALWKTFL